MSLLDTDPKKKERKEKVHTSESIVLRGIKPSEATKVYMMGVYRAEGETVASCQKNSAIHASGQGDLLSLYCGDHNCSNRHDIQSTDTDDNGAYTPKVKF